MNTALIKQLGDELFEALKSTLPISPVTERFPDLSIEQAYQIQQHMVARRIAAGERVIGKKIGVTSLPVMAMLGVGQPDFGYLLDTMVYGDGETLPSTQFIQPKAEGEIAFVLKHDLLGPGINAADVLRATEGVMACFEIVDSRIKDWKIKIADTVADNASCGAVVFGTRLINPNDIDLRTCGMVLEKNGETVVTGAGAATMNSPINAVVWLANTLGRLGIPLKAGEVILSGALGAMVPVKSGDTLRMEIGGIGSCSVRFG